MTVPVICPVCGELLTIEEHSARCESGHTFDIAASGYLNLMLSKDMHSAVPGDSRDMVLARRAFLDSGYYAPLKNALRDTISSYSPGVVLDAGCGEGYYTSAFDAPCVIGVDVSKDAVKRAAKRDRRALYCVGSIFKLPISDGSVDVVTSVFAPYCAEEFLRVTATDGMVCAVIPGKEHLWGLKSFLYDEPYPNDEEGYSLQGFSVLDTTCVDYDIEITGSDMIMQLLKMTPYFWRTPKAAIEKLEMLRSLKTRVSFRVIIYKRDFKSAP
ncbi:MAG: methyltransferase domain-containing protein [Clostridia bacterium]